MSEVLAANLEQATTEVHAKCGRTRRPWCLFLFLVILFILFTAGGPLTFALQTKIPRGGSLQHQAMQSVVPTAVETATLTTRPTAAAASAAQSTAIVPTSKIPLTVAAQTVAAVPPAALITTSSPVCGDGKCEAPESVDSCFADCPGVTTPEMCGEEPHSDPQGNAVVDGRGHHVKSAGECCDACASHAKKNPRRPCNSWVFCYMPHCWSADSGNTHLFGE